LIMTPLRRHLDGVDGHGVSIEATFWQEIHNRYLA